jgi:hypothetical protein
MDQAERRLRPDQDHLEPAAPWSTKLNRHAEADRAELPQLQGP